MRSDLYQTCSCPANGERVASGCKEEILAWVLEWAKTREEDWRRAERLSDALRDIRRRCSGRVMGTSY